MRLEKPKPRIIASGTITSTLCVSKAKTPRKDLKFATFHLLMMTFPYDRNILDRDENPKRDVKRYIINQSINHRITAEPIFLVVFREHLVHDTLGRVDLQALQHGAEPLLVQEAIA